MYRRALFIALACAAVAVSLFILYLHRYEEESSGGERVRVLVALRALERGSAVTADALTTREIPQAYVEDRSIRESDKSKILGLRVGGLVQAQQTLMWTDLTVASEEHRDLSALVQPGRRAATIRFRDETTGSLVRPGDYVDVIGVLAQGSMLSNESRSARVLLQRVLVLAVGSSMNADAVSDARTSDGRQGGLTLSVTLPEAQLLALASERETLSVALRNVDDSHTAERVPDITLSSLDAPAREALRTIGPVGPTEVKSSREVRP